MIYSKRRQQTLKAQKELIEKKEVAFYAEAVRTWFSTSMEHDKSLLTLSAGGIGLLITLLTKFEVYADTVRMLYIVAILSFCICLVSVLFIFKGNRKHLENIIHTNAIDDKVLKRLDGIALWSFGAGVVFSSLIGVSAAFSVRPSVGGIPVEIATGGSGSISASSSVQAIEIGSSSSLEKTMAIDKKPQAGRPSGTAMAQDSVNNAARLQVQKGQIKSSVDGANRLKPPTPASTGTTKTKGG